MHKKHCTLLTCLYLSSGSVLPAAEIGAVWIVKSDLFCHRQIWKCLVQILHSFLINCIYFMYYIYYKYICIIFNNTYIHMHEHIYIDM